ncbi:MAG TPA: hypothetical protein VJ783_18670 [Pirellulales bacterium]|nr:hypothetical protein [Pirellulales bacterium]
MAISPQGRSPGLDAHQAPDAEPYGSPRSTSGEAIETARYQDPNIPERGRDDRDITPPREVRTDPHRGTGEMGTEGLDPLQPLA